MKAFLETRLRPEHLVEFRMKRPGQIQRTWARLDQVHVIEPKLRRLDAEGWDVYASVNPRSAARSNEAAVGEIVALHVDIDCPGEAGQDEESRRCVRSVKNTEREENPDATQPAAGENFSRPVFFPT